MKVTRVRIQIAVIVGVMITGAMLGLGCLALLVQYVSERTGYSAWLISAVIIALLFILLRILLKLFSSANEN